jgi:hypothetical protein
MRLVQGDVNRPRGCNHRRVIPVGIGEDNLSWPQTLAALLEMMGERVTVNALSDRTGMGVDWISGRLTQAPDFESEFQKSYPGYQPRDPHGELFLVRIKDGEEESSEGSGIMLREDEFEGASWYPPGIDSRQILRIRQGGTVIQIARWGKD